MYCIDMIILKHQFAISPFLISRISDFVTLGSIDTTLLEHFNLNYADFTEQIYSKKCPFSKVDGCTLKIHDTISIKETLCLAYCCWGLCCCHQEQ